MILSDWYIYQAYIRRLTRKRLFRQLYFVPSLFLLLTLIALVCNENYSEKETHLAGLFLVVYMAVTIPKGLFCLCSLIGKAFRRLWRPAATAGTVAGLAIGLTLALIHIVCIPITGTSVNPARSIGPALMEGGQAMEQLWLFIAAPLLGGALSAGTWRFLKTDN